MSTALDLPRGALPFRFDPPDGLHELDLNVPRLLHFIWIGSPVPEKYRQNVEAFRVHNPDWMVRVWTDERVRELDLRNRDLFDAETNMGAKADILRYELVHQFGGVYLDIDMRSHGPGSIHPDMQRAWLTVSGEPWNNTNNAHFGFAKGSRFLAYVLERLREPRVRERLSIPDRTGPTFFTTCVVSFGDFRFIHPDGRELLKGLTHDADANWVGR
jgi:mannosyltransferase OCH1-like enzyme